MAFENKTLMMYISPKNKDSEFTYEGIESIYEKYGEKMIQFYQESLNEKDNTCKGTWKSGVIKKVEANQEVHIYLKPDGFTIAEWKDVIRVTPDHLFLVKQKNGLITNKRAYLLETGDELVFESAQYEEDNNGIVEDKQNIISRNIGKVEVNNLDGVKTYYDVKLDDSIISQYILLPNGNIVNTANF